MKQCNAIVEKSSAEDRQLPTNLKNLLHRKFTCLGSLTLIETNCSVTGSFLSKVLGKARVEVT